MRSFHPAPHSKGDCRLDAAAGYTGALMIRRRRIMAWTLLLALLAAGLLTAGCTRAAGTQAGQMKVVATTTFLRDIAQNVAGGQFTVRGLIPIGMDPHTYEPTPREVAEAVGSDLLITNGAGLEGTLGVTLRNAGGREKIVAASSGLVSRTPKPGEPPLESASEPDPHFWLDPVLVETYVSNIKDAFARADPGNAPLYEGNATLYIAQLRDLDAWIRAQVDLIPPAQRKLVMDHLSHGYFADRYGLRVEGAVIPSASPGDVVSAKQLTQLTALIERDGVKAIFVELGENPGLAKQVAAEAHVKVVTDLLDHSLTAPSGPAPTYLAMMRYDTNLIVEALR